jgi:hypothetical protein
MLRLFRVGLIAGIVAVGAVAWSQALPGAFAASSTPERPAPASPMPPPPGAPGGPGPGAPGFMPAATDSFAAERDSLTNDLMQHIAGREDAPAESVFKNLKVIRGVSASRMLRMMNMGFGRSLGVRCQFCHVLGHWADDDKKPKAAARDMLGLVDGINSDLVPKMKSFADDHVIINCGTCHQGHHKPPRFGGPRPGEGPPRGGEGQPTGPGGSPEHHG